MLVSALPLLARARRLHYAVPAFNFNTLETLRAVMRAAEDLRSPIILQTSEGGVAYAGMEYLVAVARVASQVPIPIVLHLDHGKNIEVIRQAIRSGYTSIMIDGSALPYAENVEVTRTVVRLAHARSISVEAELGSIRGIEDLVRVEDRDATLTDPTQAATFVQETKCDTLAVAIGTAHGARKQSSADTHIDVMRLTRIAAYVSIPLVLHGASGVREDIVALARRHGASWVKMRGILDEDITQAIKHGVAKINIDTDLRLACTAGIREALDESPDLIDPRDLLTPAMALMTDAAKQKMLLFGSVGRG